MKPTLLYHPDGNSRPVAHSQEIELTDLTPNFGSANFSDTSTLTGRSFATLQLRAKNAVRALLHSAYEQILVICGNSRVDELQTAVDLVTALSQLKPVVARAARKEQLLGKNGQGGLIHGFGVLILPCALLCDHPKWIGPLSAALHDNPAIKLILCGSGTDCADLSLFWPELDYALHADLVFEFPASDGINLVGQLLACYQKRLQVKACSVEAVELFCRLATRQSGDRRWLGIAERTLHSLLTQADKYAKGALIDAKAVLKAFAAADFRVNFLAESELREHRDQQLLIATQGAAIGQVNGLSVVETFGSSYEFGEPVRITATLRAGGEGDVIDIERKAELAGQIHAKAMMIINGYLMKEFGAEQPLPVSASLVFEQSYSEIDGDSASLTGLCAVLSCLAGVPIRQDLALTGSVDQFGHVQPVGGVNEKIEGFFKVCRLHGLTGSQGVVIPETCVPQLVLRPAVVRAVKQGKFHLYTVSHVTDAIELLTTVPWGSKEEQGTIAQRIVERMAQIGQSGHNERPWWKFWE